MIDTSRLTNYQIELICHTINDFGSSDHPVADSTTLRFFTTDYAKSCIERAIEADYFSAEALRGAEEAIRVIGP